MTSHHETTAEWSVNEYLGYHWPSQRVSYALTSRPEGHAFMVVDEAGRKIPAQVDPRNHRVYYIADLPAHARKHYDLRQVESNLQSPLAVQVSADSIEIINRHFGLRLPWGSKITGPILAIRGVDRIWFGGSSFGPQTKVVSFHSRIVATGPVFVEIKQDYALAEGGTLHFSYVIDAESPTVRITQIQSGRGDGSVVWHLGRGFRPTRAYWRPFHPTPPRAQGEWMIDGYQRQVYSVRYPDQPDTVSMRLLYNWNLDESNLWAGWQVEDRRDLLFLGVIRPSETRVPPEYHPLVLYAGSAPDGHYLDANIPLQEGRKVFALGILDREQTNASCPASVGPANDIDMLYARLNMPGLDDYYQMTLDWPGLADLKFPRLWMKSDELPAIRDKMRKWTWLNEAFQSHADDELFNSYESPNMHLRKEMNPLGRDLGGAYLVSGNEDYARREEESLLNQLDTEIQLFLTYGPGIEFMTGIRIARRLRTLVLNLDLLLSSSVLSASERLDVLRKLAFLAEVVCSDDGWPATGAGMNRGNPNFHSDVVSARGMIASLLGGHPCQKQWIEAAVREIDWVLYQYSFTSGCFNEAPTYQFCFISYALQMQAAVAAQGYKGLCESPQFKKALRYLAAIQTPLDERCGHRMIPTIGHVTSHGHCQSMSAYFGWAAKAYKEVDPEFSRQMMSAWQRGGRYAIPLHEFWNGMVWSLPICLLDPDLPAEEEPEFLVSKVHEGLGPVLRAAHDDGSEGYILFKCGQSRGHYDADEGSLIWYAFGKPMLIDYGTQYTPLVSQPWMNNRISVDHKMDNLKAGTILHSSLQMGFDFVCGQMEIDRLQAISEWPARYLEDHDANCRLPWHDVPRHLWRRYLLYIHDLETIVLLDDIQGSLPTDWSIQVLADSVRTTTNSAVFKGQLGVDLSVHFAQPADPQLLVTGFSHLGFDEPEQHHAHWRSVAWTAAPGVKIGPLGEKTVILRASAQPSRPYLAVLAAHPANEAAPKVAIAPDAAEMSIQSHRGTVRLQLSPSFDLWHIRLNTPKQKGDFSIELPIQ